MSLRNEGTSAIAWSLIEKILKRGVQFVLSIFLARLLTPSDFGVVAMATIFVSWAEVFSDFGMGQAIIQRKEVTDTQKSTVFYINLIMGVLIAVVFVLIAPWAARFYDNDMVAWVVRVSGLTFILQALNVVQSSLFRKTLNFKIGTVASLLSSVISGGVGIVMAYCGFGVWSLLAQNVFSVAITTLYYWIKSDWRPKPVFDFKETKPLFIKGVGFMGQGLISNVFSSLDSMAIGKLFSSASLGLFSRGRTLAGMPQNTLLTPVTRPLFPIFAKVNDDKNRVHELYLRSMRMLTWVSTLIGGFMLLLSYEIIIILYGNQWGDAAKYLFLFSLLIPLQANNVSTTAVWKACGHVKELVKITFIGRLLNFLSLAGLFHSIELFVYVHIVTESITALINAIWHKRITDISLFSQYKEMLSELLLIIITYVLFYFIKFESVYISAIIKTIVFGAVYFIGCKCFRIEGMKSSFEYLKHAISKMRQK